MSEPRRKASRQVTLVLSGALSCAAVTGCVKSVEQMDVQWCNDTKAYTNNAYTPGCGYYHAASRVWYPYSWGHYDPARGYFYDGNWSSTPMSMPGVQRSIPMGVGHSVSHTSFMGISRGGFGSSAHFAGS